MDENPLETPFVDFTYSKIEDFVSSWKVEDRLNGARLLFSFICFMNKKKHVIQTDFILTQILRLAADDEIVIAGFDSPKSHEKMHLM